MRRGPPKRAFHGVLHFPRAALRYAGDVGVRFAAARVGVAGLALAGCAPGRSPAPPAVSAAPAPAGLDVTMDPAVHGIIEDDARRHDPPPAALQRRVYSVGAPWVRWSPPSTSREELGDRVTMRGWPAPRPGQRFVVFDDEGRQGVIEATGERCPPGHEDCIVCADDDPRRIHWARIVEAPGPIPDHASAFGPFAADETLPSPRPLADPWMQRGRWEVRDVADLDGDGVADRRDARMNCHEGHGCEARERWLLHDGRWYAEPAAPPQIPAPMHLLEPEVWPWPGGTRIWSSYAHIVMPGQPVGEKERAAHGIVVHESFLDAEPPRTGDYWLVSRRGVLATLRVTPKERPRRCSMLGPPCAEARFVGAPVKPPKDWVVLAGPVPEGVTVRHAKMLRDFRGLFTATKAGPVFSLELSDGRWWTIGSRPCTRLDHGGPRTARCMLSELELPGASTHRRVVAEFTGGMQWDQELVCSKMSDPPPLASPRAR